MDPYVQDFLRPLRECLRYKPAFGTKAGINPEQFLDLYQEDLFYSSVGLASEELYVAHKAAGGITSFYRQLGVACEVLTRSVLTRELGIPPANVRWNYTLPTGGEKDRLLTLDARLCPSDIPDPEARFRAAQWLGSAAAQVGISPQVASGLVGAVFEVRQGYKSADSKRQNADLSFGIHALKAGYLPCLLVFSGQVSEVVIRRYRAQGLYVIMGSGRVEAHLSTPAFFQEVAGWDLAGWLGSQGPTLREEVRQIMASLLNA